MSSKLPLSKLSLVAEPIQPLDLSSYDHKQSPKAIFRWVSNVTGLSLKWPLETATVLRIAEMAGYECDKAKLNYLIQRGHIEPPAKEGRCFLWKPEDAAALLDTLEDLRAWQPMHPSHEAKLSSRERLKHQEEFASRKALVEAFRGMTTNDLFNLLVDCDKVETRRLMVSVLKLRLTGGVHLRSTEVDEAKLEAAACN